MDMEERMKALEHRVSNVEEKLNTVLPEIQTDIREIKILLKERPEQEQLKNTILKTELSSVEKRVSKLEDRLEWLWRTLGATIITTVAGAIFFVIKIM